MKMVFKFDGIDCAVCALKLEEKIKKIPNVNICSINFLAQRIEIDALDKSIIDELTATCSSFEDGVSIKRIK